MIADVASRLSAEEINIQDIEVLKVREGEGGTIRLGFGQQAEADRSVDILQDAGYQVRFALRGVSMYEVKEARGLIGECDVSEHPETTLYLLGAAAMFIAVGFDPSRAWATNGKPDAHWICCGG